MFGVPVIHEDHALWAARAGRGLAAHLSTCPAGGHQGVSYAAKERPGRAAGEPGPTCADDLGRLVNERPGAYVIG